MTELLLQGQKMECGAWDKNIITVDLFLLWVLVGMHFVYGFHVIQPGGTYYNHHLFVATHWPRC